MSPAARPPVGAALVGRVAREPLLHFVFLGGVAFALHAVSAARAANDIVITQQLKAELAAEVTDKKGHQPTPQDIRNAIDAWKREEVFYREGLRRGLDRGDPLVRARVAAMLREIESRLSAPAPASAGPSDDELLRFFSANRAAYVAPDGTIPSFEELKSRVRIDYQDDARGKALDAIATRLMARYRFVEERWRSREGGGEGAVKEP